MEFIRKIIKKIFPKYESKNAMKLRYEQALAFERGFNRVSFATVERDVIKVCAVAKFDEKPIPTEVLKRNICRDIAEYIQGLVEYDLQDENDYRGKCLIGTIYVSSKRSERR